MDSSGCSSSGIGSSWPLDSFSKGGFLLYNQNNKLRIKSNLISVKKFQLFLFRFLTRSQEKLWKLESFKVVIKLLCHPNRL